MLSGVPVEIYWAFNKLWNNKFYYKVASCWYFYWIILHLCLGLQSGLYPSGFPNKTLCTPLLSPIRATCPSNLILLDLIFQKILGEEYRLLISSLCSFPHSLVTPSLLGPNILLSTPFSNTLSLRFSLNVSDFKHNTVLIVEEFKFCDHT